jgi:hypothetical protein
MRCEGIEAAGRHPCVTNLDMPEAFLTVRFERPNRFSSATGLGRA